MNSSVRHRAAGHNQDEGAEWCAIRWEDDEVNVEKIAAFGSSYAPVGAAEGCDLFTNTPA
jgi:hypothetical protein